MRVIAIFMVVFVCGCATIPSEVVTDRIFRGEPEFSKLEPIIQKWSLLRLCPEPSFAQIRFDIKESGDGDIYGREVSKLDNYENGLTRVTLTASGNKAQGLLGIRGRPSSSGKVLSCAGLLNIAYREQLEQTGVPLNRSALDLMGLTEPPKANIKQPNRRFEITEILNSNGGIFPLEVGNELDVNYVALFQKRPNRKGYADYKNAKHITYKVVDVITEVEIGGNKISGNVYLIEQRYGDEKDNRKTVYYFSEVIGWVVKEVEYLDGKAIFIKELSSWYEPQTSSWN